MCRSYILTTSHPTEQQLNGLDQRIIIFLNGLVKAAIYIQLRICVTTTVPIYSTPHPIPPSPRHTRTDTHKLIAAVLPVKGDST